MHKERNECMKRNALPHEMRAILLCYHPIENGRGEKEGWRDRDEGSLREPKSDK